MGVYSRAFFVWLGSAALVQVMKKHRIKLT
ncbi:hypothetical protein MOTE_22280 [Moorella thermoacetica]|uniref:Uncharacterized protein n=1 Tax=Neomoorella thermoacetica TaxID=1525 RepID=A0A1J5NQN5_NEOTH|nr:hypothetical protein MOTE_22280 [Moorella thermoacetica]